jgi:7-keto-8-aminopelargonate synthetase-like enzyme
MKFTDEKINLVDAMVTLGSAEKICGLHAEDAELDGRHITVNGRRLINLCSLSYLGLEKDARLRDAVIDAVTRYGTVMAMTSTFCATPQARELQTLLAQLFEAPAIITPTTTLGHLSTFAVMIQAGDQLLIDSQAHNSVQLAAKTVTDKAQATLIPHSNMKVLRRKLERLAGTTGNIWYLADGIYSMFGDKAPLEELHQLMEEFPNLYAYIDDAHGMSVEGKNGKGYVLGSRYLHRRMIVSVSLSKAFGVGGGGAVVFQDHDWYRKVETCGPIKIFSNQLQIPTVAAAVASAKIHLSEEIGVIQARYQERVRHFERLAEQAGIPVVSVSGAPMKYVIAGGRDSLKTIQVSKGLQADGFLISPVSFPAVSINQSGCRFSLNNHLTFNDIERLVGSIAANLKAIA